MSEKFTKGPWVAYDVDDPFSEYTHIVVQKRGGAIGYSPKETERELGFTRFKKEDAHLIAAAPDMYDMLMHIKDKVLYPMSHMGGDFAMFGEGFGIATNELLKKARGES